MRKMIFAAVASYALSMTICAGSFAMPAEDTTIRTSTGTFKLSPSNPAELIGEASLRSGRRAAELALTALAADLDQFNDQKKKLDADFTALKRRVDTITADFAARGKALDAEIAALDAKSNAYEADVKAHNAEVDDHRTQVNASNAQRPEQRSSATVSRLNAWGNSLDVKKAALDSRSDALDWEGAVYNQRVARYEADVEKQSAEVDLAYEKLFSRRDELITKLGEAYRQLEVCYSYAKKIDALLAEKYSVNMSSSTGIMKDAGERLKELSNAGFDGSKDKLPLTESNKGPNTEFFK